MGTDTAAIDPDVQESDLALVLNPVLVLVPRQWNGVCAGMSGQGFLGPASLRVIFSARGSA